MALTRRDGLGDRADLLGVEPLAALGGAVGVAWGHDISSADPREGAMRLASDATVDPAERAHNPGAWPVWIPVRRRR